jgi:iron complex transport system substrate-binding protein
LTVTDGAGRQVRLEHAPQRIVSYLPSNTETLYALGVGDRIVGTDNFSDYPAEAQGKPKLGGLQTNLEALVALRPDLVVSTGTKPDFATLLEPQHIPVLVLAYNDLPGTLGNMELLGKVVGKPAEAAALAGQMRNRMEAVQAKTRTAPPVRVYYELDASDPSKPYTAGPGSFINDLLVMAGGSNIAAGATGPYPQISAEEVVRANPELIVVPVEASPPSAATSPARFLQRPGWDGIAAVQAGAIRGVESDLVSRPGPRLVDGLDALARVIHPELFP